MDIFFIRHGIAAERSLYAQDRDRPLTAAGRVKTARIARRLHAIGLKFDLMLSSPYRRARQTAEILLAEQLAPHYEFCDALMPGGSWHDWASWWQQWCALGDRAEASLALVGHQPSLGNWAELLVWGRASAKLTVKKAGIVGVRLSPGKGDPTARGELFLLSAPKWLL
ncbi:MAG: phosphohistidine phosphatase SixA [Cyanobacteria bacterium J06641_5]